jgi:pimeloyl-ACP methyl ester carboxylesterase
MSLRNSKKEKIDAELGHLIVTENRNNPRSHLIELAFVRFKSTSPNPGSPIVYLAGGPGGSGISSAKGSRFPLFMAMREFGDVIVLDQRGTGISKPNLSCRESFDLPTDQPGAREEMIRIAQERSAKCAQYWREQGVDLSGYNTNENADDVESLRQAIGARKMSLWSISYGTHLTLAIIKRHGSTIDRAILAGVNGLDDRRKLPSEAQNQLVLIGQLVKADPNLSKLIPNFLRLMGVVLNQLETQPMTVEITDPQTKQRAKLAISKLDLQFLTAQSLGNTQAVRSLPSLYYAMSKGNFQTFAQQVLGFRRSRIPSAMTFMMDCASGGTKERYARIKREENNTLLGNAINLPFPEVCAAWGSPDLGDSFRAAVKSKIPVLFISGTLDGRTPPSRAEAVRKGFPHSTHLIIEGAGHDDDLFLSSPEIKNTIFGFMRGVKMPATINITTVPRFEFRQPQ